MIFVYRFIFDLFKLYTFFTILFLLNCSSQKGLLYLNDPDNILDNSKQQILCIPVNNFEVDYSDNTKLIPDTQFTDSFLVEATNGLICFECRKFFSVHRFDKEYEKLKDSVSLFYNQHYSYLEKDSNESAQVCSMMKETAEKFNVDLILLPYSCNLKHRTFQPRGWTESPSYQHPVKHIAKAEIHVQIWDKQGKLLYENIGKREIGKFLKPVLYPFFKKDKPDEDIVKFAKSYYAPPLIKSLSKAIAEAIDIR